MTATIVEEAISWALTLRSTVDQATDHENVAYVLERSYSVVGAVSCTIEVFVGKSEVLLYAPG